MHCQHQWTFVLYCVRGCHLYTANIRLHTVVLSILVSATTIPIVQENTVMQIFCTHSEPNFSLPWQRKRQYSSTSSGFITDGKRILTNAHCVDHHTQVRHCLHPSRLSQGTALSLHSAFRLVSMHSFFSAFSLLARLKAQLLWRTQISGLS